MKLNILQEYRNKLNNSYTKMDFPKNEINNLQKQNRIITTRVPNEYEKYHLDQIIITSWNKLFRIISINSFKDHPYYDDPKITNDMKKQVTEYNKFQVITLEKVSKESKLLNMTKLFQKILNSFKWKLNNIYWKYSEYPVDSNGEKYDKIPANMFAGCVVKGKYIYLNTPEKMIQVMKNWKVYNKYTLKEFYTLILVHELSHIVWKYKLSEKQKIKELNKISSDFTTEYLKVYNLNHPKYNEEKFCEYQAMKYIKRLKK